jgi:hypothetical protein
MSVDQVRQAFEACFEAHKGDCGEFARAVAGRVGVTLGGNADAIVTILRGGAGWTLLADGVAAAQSAEAGKLVIGGPKGSEQEHPDPYGHVAVVVGRPLKDDAYPSAYWGRLGGKGAKDEAVDWAWRAGDRDRVSDAAHDLGQPSRTSSREVFAEYVERVFAREMHMPNGIDLATDAGRVIVPIRAANLDFVARYYRSPTSHFPTLSASEARLLSSSGLSIVAVWKSASNHPAYFSRLAGVDDFTSAYHQAHTIGQPAGSCIYFAVDYDASGQDIVGPIDEYFRGIAAGFAAAGGDGPDYKVGVYGSGAVCRALNQAGLAQYAWLVISRGWAGYNALNAWHIRQGKALPGLSFNHDSDEATDDYGGFQVT